MTGCDDSYGHSMALYDEVLEATSPVSGKPVVQVVFTEWSDGAYVLPPAIKFKDAEGNTWAVMCYGNEPDDCNVYYIPAKSDWSIAPNHKWLPYIHRDVIEAPLKPLSKINHIGGKHPRYELFDETNLKQD